MSRPCWIGLLLLGGTSALACGDVLSLGAGEDTADAALQPGVDGGGPDVTRPPGDGSSGVVLPVRDGGSGTSDVVETDADPARDAGANPDVRDGSPGDCECAPDNRSVVCPGMVSDVVCMGNTRCAAGRCTVQCFGDGGNCMPP